MMYLIHYESNASGKLYVRAKLISGCWSAVTRNGVCLFGERGYRGLDYVLSEAIRIPEKLLVKNDLDFAISLKEAEAL